MPGLFDAFASALLYAQKAAPGGAAPNPLVQYVPLILVICLWFYLLMIRPQQKQDKLRRDMLGALKKNDKVLTSAGIYGTVTAIDDKDDRVVLRIDDDRGVKVAFSKASIVKVLGAMDDKEKSPKEKAAETA